MTKFVETLNNIVKLVSTLATLAVLGGIVYGVLWLYQKAGEMTANPPRIPDIGKMLPENITLPKIEAPEINLKAPKIDLSGLFGGGSDTRAEKSPVLVA